MSLNDAFQWMVDFIQQTDRTLITWLLLPLMGGIGLLLMGLSWWLGHSSSITSSPYTLLPATDRRPEVVSKAGSKAERSANSEAMATQPTLASTVGSDRPSKLTRKQRRALVRYARQEYATARGFAHRQILEQAHRRLHHQIDELKTAIGRSEAQLHSVETQRTSALTAQLEHHLVHDRLDEVPGIGPSLKERILAATQARKLADLHRAYIVSGVGQSRQLEIERWIQGYSARLPQLVNEPFPGRSEIMNRFEGHIAEVNRQRTRDRQALAALERQWASLEPHYTWLSQVTPKHFEHAALGLADDMAKVDRFLIGAFAEWEPLPAWFKEAIALGSK
jgi:hypothetical protein